MTDFASMPGEIPGLKRAAIDAYMRDAGGWQINGDKYEISSSSTRYTVTRPGADGQGGGDWDTNNFIAEIFTDRDEEFRTAFDNIRDRIDKALEPWTSNVPDPTRIETLVESMRQANRTLRVSAGESTGAGAIDGNLGLIGENSDAMSGTTIATFKSLFLSQLRAVVGGHHAITVILGGALAGQKHAWEDARQNVADVVKKSQDALNAYATGGGADWDVICKVAGWAGKGVGAFVTGGASGIVAAFDLGITVIDAATGKDRTFKGSGDAESLMKAFEDGLKGVADEIKAAETALRDNINTNLSHIGKDRSSYDIDKTGIGDLTSAQAEVVVINENLVDEISDVYMPAISAELNTASQKAYAAGSSGPLNRHSSIGLSSTGLHSEWWELGYLLYELLKNLQWEVDTGAVSLKLAVDDILHTDGDVKKRMDEQTKKVKDGSIFDPWNEYKRIDGTTVTPG